MIVIDASGLTMRRPDKTLFEDLSLTVSDGDRIGVVGINGCGKSTLLRVIAGEREPEGGVVRRGRGVRVAVLDQHPHLPKGKVADAVPGWEGAAILDRLGMGPLADADIATLSGGQAKRVALAEALVSEAELLILDEPTNHLDLDAITWLEERLARLRNGLLMVTHDRHVLDKVCTKVLELDRGKAYIHEGGYQGYLDGRATREEQAVTAESVRANQARKELAWLRRGAPARTRKPKAHVDAARALVESRPQAAARAATLGFGSATSRRGEGQGPTAGAQQGSFRQGVDERQAPRLGNKVIELEGVGHRFADRQTGDAGVPADRQTGDAGVPADPDRAAGPWLFRGLTLSLEPGGRYGIVGANGSGKTTLLEILAGRLPAAEGTVDVGPTVRIGVYDQFGRELDLSMRVREAVAKQSGAPGSPEDLRLMEAFWFDTDAQWAEIATLSGGERRRLQLLLTLIERPNVLLLDEPTNDLDLDTLRALEDFLEDWPGTVVAVSHDRAFMDRTAEDVIAIEDGRAALVMDGYAGWMTARMSGSATGQGAGRADPRTGTNRPGAVLAGSVRPMPGSAPATAPPEFVNSATAAPGESVRATPRSPSTLRQLIKDVDKDIAKLTAAQGKTESELADLSAALAQPGGGDHRALAAAGGRLSDIAAKLAAAEERWLELAQESEVDRR